MTRRLVPLRRLIEDTEDQGDNPDALYVDPDDVVELEDDEQEEG